MCDSVLRINLHFFFIGIRWFLAVFVHVCIIFLHVYTAEQISYRDGGQKCRCRKSISTYDSLRDSDVVGWRSRCRLIWSAGITKNGQLLGALDTALAQASQLNPVGADWLVSCDHKIVTFACKTEINVKLIFFTLKSCWNFREKKTNSTHKLIFLPQIFGFAQFSCLVPYRANF